MVLMAFISVFFEVVLVLSLDQLVPLLELLPNLGQDAKLV